MRTIKHRLVRIRSQVAFPALAVTMGLSTLVAGLDHTAFLSGKAAPKEHTLTASELDRMTLVEAARIATSTNVGLDVTLGHARIDAWVHRFTTSLRGDFTVSLTRMDQYAAMITKKLDARDMPRELIYLAMIESNFNPSAKSKAGAVGLWQFMSSTARSFGLQVKGKTDERKNPVEATDAALSYLSQLHDRFGSWYLAAAAYNSGAGTVSKALRKVTGKATGTDEDFFRILSALPRETQDYVPKLIAAAKVGSDPAQYGIVN